MTAQDGGEFSGAVCTSADFSGPPWYCGKPAVWEGETTSGRLVRSCADHPTHPLLLKATKGGRTLEVST